MEGSLDEYDLVHVVQTVGAGTHPTRIELRDDEGDLVGSLLLCTGEIVSARADELHGFEAVRRLFKTPRARRFYVYRADETPDGESVGRITLVLAQVLSHSVPPAPNATPILLQGSLAETNLRDVAAAVSLGRVCVGIEVFAPDGRRVGALYLRGGKVLFAAWGRSAGEAALSELFKPRRDGRFVMFRSTDARVGEPLANLSDVLRPKRMLDTVTLAMDSAVADSDNEEDEDGEVTLVVAPPKPSTPPPAGNASAFGQDASGPNTGTRSIVRKSFPPPAEGPVRGASESPPAPRFRHSDRPHAASPDAGSILLSELGYGPGAVSQSPKGPVVAITSPRGGAGRTTLALNLAVSLARRGRRVLLLDADANTLLPALRAPERSYFGAADVLSGRAALEAAILSTRVPGLSLLPSGDLNDSNYGHDGWGHLLSQLSSRFDLVLVDCAPVFYGATPSILRYASHQLVVVAAEPSARAACKALQERIQAQLIEPPAVLGIVLNMLDYQVRASVNALEQLSESEYASQVFDIPIPRSPAFMEASARGIPIAHGEAGISSTIGWVFETLATSLLERLALEEPAFDDSSLLT
jgi:chromosome partitioning protein